MDTIDRELFEVALEGLDSNHGLEIEPVYAGGRVFGAHCLAVIGTAWNTFGTSLVLYFPGWAFGPTPPK